MTDKLRDIPIRHKKRGKQLTLWMRIPGFRKPVILGWAEPIPNSSEVVLRTFEKGQKDKVCAHLDIAKEIAFNRWRYERDDKP